MRFLPLGQKRGEGEREREQRERKRNYNVCARVFRNFTDKSNFDHFFLLLIFPSFFSVLIIISFSWTWHYLLKIILHFLMKF